MNSTFFRSICAAVACIAFFPQVIIAPLHSATAPAALKAQTWDEDVTLGPGGYRGEKTLKVKGRMTVEKGALIEKVKIDGGRGLKGNFDGAFLRECSINGELSARLEAKDTIFEDCKFGKIGGWWVDMWSTAWRFENWVFRRSSWAARWV